MKEYMVNFRGYAYIWADSEKEAEKIFARRFKRAGVNGAIERYDTEDYQELQAEERLWK